MAVRIEKDGPVWTVIHDRPEARNAMDPASADALTAAFLEFDADKDAFVAVFYGAGGAFCAGWDLKYVSTLDPDYPLGELDISTARPRGNGGEIPRGPLGPSRLELDKPVIAAIEGPAVAGGMELGLWCDFRVMAQGSYFGVYCRRWGVPLIDGGTVRLPRIVGQGRALEIILTGRKVPAEECLTIGLCEYVTPKGGARAKAEELAREIARFPQVCVRRSSLRHQESRAWRARGLDSGMVQRARSADRGRRGRCGPLQSRAGSTRRLRQDSVTVSKRRGHSHGEKARVIRLQLRGGHRLFTRRRRWRLDFRFRHDRLRLRYDDSFQ
ncbi:MAG TPA: crotonase/enoyl-CoA hydratase family protein [Bradyrhizobium sp.]|nr:crotonase/enoyl-CoA hydratase family protein [Bradyrhizobium sp.]